MQTILQNQATGNHGQESHTSGPYTKEEIIQEDLNEVSGASQGSTPVAKSFCSNRLALSLLLHHMESPRGICAYHHGLGPIILPYQAIYVSPSQHCNNTVMLVTMWTSLSRTNPHWPSNYRSGVQGARGVSPVYGSAIHYAMDSVAPTFAYLHHRKVIIRYHPRLKIKPCRFFQASIQNWVKFCRDETSTASTETHDLLSVWMRGASGLG